MLCDVDLGRGGSWNGDNVIIFASSDGGIHRVSGAGGIPVEVAAPDAEDVDSRFRWPHFLPDGHHFFYTVITGTCCPPLIPAVVRLATLDARDPPVTLFEAESAVSYAAGHLFFARGDVVMAQPFDAGTRRVMGDPFPIGDDVSWEGSRYVSIAASANGTVVFGHGGGPPPEQLSWYTRDGRALRVLDGTSVYESLALSPDVRHIAVARRSGSPRNLDIWLVDAVSGDRSRVT